MSLVGPPGYDLNYKIIPFETGLLLECMHVLGGLRSFPKCILPGIGNSMLSIVLVSDDTETDIPNIETRRGSADELHSYCSSVGKFKP